MRALPCLVLAVTAALLAACSKPAPDRGPRCDVIVDNLLAVSKTQLAGHGDMALGDRAAMLAQCEKRNLTAAQRRCLASAKDLTALAGCVPRPAPPATTTAPAAH